LAGVRFGPVKRPRNVERVALAEGWLEELTHQCRDGYPSGFRRSNNGCLPYLDSGLALVRVQRVRQADHKLPHLNGVYHGLFARSRSAAPGSPLRSPKNSNSSAKKSASHTVMPSELTHSTAKEVTS